MLTYTYLRPSLSWMRLFNAFSESQQPKEIDNMLVSKKPRNVCYGRTSNESHQQQSNVSSSSKSGDTEKQTKPHSSSQSSKTRPKARPSQPGSTLEFESERNHVNKPLFRSNGSNNGSDSEMQDGETVAQPDPADDADTEEEGEIRPILSGTRRKRTEAKRKAIMPSSNDDDDHDESAEENLKQSPQTQQNVIELSSDESQANDSLAQEERTVKQAAKYTQQKKKSGSRAQTIVEKASEENEMGEWTQEDAEDWYDYFVKSNSDGSFDVEKIIRWRRHPRKKNVQYRVKWENFRDWSNTWITGKHFNSRKGIDEFWRSQKKMYGIRRPVNTYKGDDDRLRESDLDLDDQDTDNEIGNSDSERRERACKRKIDDIRRDRFRLRQLKLRRQGKDANLASSGKRKRHDSSDEDNLQDDTVMTVSSDDNDDMEQNSNMSRSRDSTTEDQSRTETPIETFVVDDEDNDDDGGEYVDSLQDDYMPLPKSSATPALEHGERESSQPAQASRSSTGEASLQLATSSNSAKNSFPTRSREEEAQRVSASPENEEGQTQNELMAFAATFAPSVIPPVRRSAKNGRPGAKGAAENNASTQEEVHVASNNHGSNPANHITEASETSERHAWMGAHRAPPKIKTLNITNDPFQRLSGPSDGKKRRRFTLSGMGGRTEKNVDKIVPLEQLESTSAVDRLFANKSSSSNNRIDHQAENKIVPVGDAFDGWDTDVIVREADKPKDMVQLQNSRNESDFNDHVRQQLDTNVTDLQDDSCGWGAVEESHEEGSIADRAYHMAMNSPLRDQYQNDRDQCRDYRSERSFRSRYNTFATHTGRDDDREEYQMNISGGSHGWYGGDNTNGRNGDANARENKRISFGGVSYSATPNKIASQSMHPDRRSQLDSSDATLNEAFLDVQISSSASPNHSCWRRDAPLPTQKDSLRAAAEKKKGCIPKSDSGMVIADNKHEGRYVDIPSSYAASETGDSEGSGRRSVSVGGKNLDPEMLRKAQTWPWTKEFNEIVKTHDHLVSKQKHEGDSKIDEMAKSLISYIIYKKGGYKTSLEDLLRESPYRTSTHQCVMWILDPLQPLGDDERKCLKLPNFKFITLKNPDKNCIDFKFIWKSDKRNVMLYSLGALVCKVIEWCQARRIKDENKALQVFDFEGKVLCHQWQRLTISTLLEAKRMGEFLEQILEMDNPLATEFESMMYEEGISVSDNLENCSGKWTSQARSYPDERPDRPEKLPKDLKVFTLNLDREVHTTLMTLQYWCRGEFRSFIFAIAGCSMEATQIGTCYSRVDVPSTAEHPDAN